MIIPVEIADQDAQYIVAAFSEGYTPQIQDEVTGEMIDNPISQQDFALANVLALLKTKVKDYMERQAVGQAQQAVEDARIAAAAQAQNIQITIQQ